MKLYCGRSQTEGFLAMQAFIKMAPYDYLGRTLESVAIEQDYLGRKHTHRPESLDLECRSVMILMIHFDEAEFGLGCASLFQREAVNSFEATIVAASPLLISSLLEQFSR